MYIPSAYKVTDESQALRIMAQCNFADLVTYHDGCLQSNKLPLLVDAENKVLYGHMGRTNPQLTHLEHNCELLVIFSGPHAYVSPQWYVSDNMVPTWNFQTVQVRGKAAMVDADTLLQNLAALSDFHESGFTNSWSMDQLDPDKLTTLLNVIQGFRIEISTIECKEKMSQNRSHTDQQSIASCLQQTDDQTSRQVAEIMLKNL